MDRIIVTVDLGHFRAYRITETPGGSARAELIEGYDSLEGHGKLGEKLTDAAGSFSRGSAGGETAGGSGQPNKLELEIRKKLSRMIAKDINFLVEREGCRSWYLAAPGKINGTIVKGLKPGVKDCMKKNITADLTKINKSEIASHFE